MERWLYFTSNKYLVNDREKRKEQLWGELQHACDTFEKALFVNTDNVTSKQICVMRKSMRDIGAVMICGKNTMMKAAINNMN